MLKSFINNTPTILQSEQFIVLAMVKGRGIDAADFVAMTFFSAAKGLAKRMINIKIPSLPTISAANCLGNFDTKKEFARISQVTPKIWWFIVPGRFDDPGGQYFLNSLK